MKINWHNLKRIWAERINSAPVGSFLETGCGSRIERRTVGWFGYDAPKSNGKRMDAEHAAIKAAAWNFATIKHRRKTLPI